MENNYWIKFYKKTKRLKHSSFAEFVLPCIKENVIELGSGNGRDLSFFHKNNITAHGVDIAYEDRTTTKMDIKDYIKLHSCNEDVYTRFFWHSIDRKLQLDILKWTKNYLFLEARTTDDKFRPKVFKKHERNFVNVSQLVKDLKDNKFQILFLREGTGFSKFKGEDPFLVRIIAKKNG